jgi:hypothetical protein
MRRVERQALKRTAVSWVIVTSAWVVVAVFTGDLAWPLVGWAATTFGIGLHKATTTPSPPPDVAN